jgi:rhodanese-related sulfurtransferase
VAGARHIAEAQLSERLKELEKYKSRPVIVSCNAGSRAPSVSDVLRKNGFAEAFALKGGIAAWQQASLPLEKG